MAHHKEQDHQSLLLHAAAVAMMKNDDRLIDRALGIIDRWMSDTTPNERINPSFEVWRNILTNKNWDEALSTSEKGNQLRQSSPCACILPNQKRLEIIKSCKKNNSNI